jgi:hypothetical protein
VEPDAGVVGQRDDGERDPVAALGERVEEGPVQGAPGAAAVGGTSSNETTVSVTNGA